MDINVSKQPDDPDVSSVRNLDGSTTYTYGYSDTYVYMQSKTMSELYIVKGDGMDSATVSFDSATGTFSGTITLTVPAGAIPLSLIFKANVYYQFTGQQAGKSIYRYSVGLPNLKGANITNFTISPSSTTIDGTIIDNTVVFSSSSGSFSGQVNQETPPNSDVTYTITFW